MGVIGVMTLAREGVALILPILPITPTPPSLRTTQVTNTHRSETMQNAKNNPLPEAKNPPSLDERAPPGQPPPDHILAAVLENTPMLAAYLEKGDRGQGESRGRFL